MRTSRLVGPVVGLISAAVAVGVGEAAAALVRPAAAPVVAVANRVVLATPGSTKRSAIDTFGTSDKTVLVVAVYLVLAVFGVLVGVLALRRVGAAVLAVLGLGVFGAWCAVTDSAGRPGDAFPSLLAGAVAALVLRELVRAVRADEALQPGGVPVAPGSAGSDGRDGSELPLLRRRTLLKGGAVGLGLAALAGFGGRALQRSRFDVAAARAKVRLPAPRSGETTATQGTDLGRSGVPWATPSSEFYRIDTALQVPQIDPSSWQLRIHGMVDREITLTYDQLLARPLVERWVTLCCVSNPVGGDLIGNARWRGALLADLLREAGLHPDCDQLLFSSPDGMTIGAPTAVVMDGRDALLAVGMNGAPLPVEHGFPARIVVPGLYGYVSACKWVVDVEATTFAARNAYWIAGGWAQQNAVKLESRIDTPRSGATLTAGTPVSIAGVAWDQHVGVSAVEVAIDGGPWQQARLATVPSTDTWRQWVLPWTPQQPGTHTLRVRAVDGRGTPQVDEPQPVFPSGATGLHTVTVTVRPAAG